MSRVEPAKEYSVVYYDPEGAVHLFGAAIKFGRLKPAHEYIEALDLSAAMQTAQTTANKHGIFVESVAEVLWKRDA